MMCWMYRLKCLTFGMRSLTIGVASIEFRWDFMSFPVKCDMLADLFEIPEDIVSDIYIQCQVCRKISGVEF